MPRDVQRSFPGIPLEHPSASEDAENLLPLDHGAPESAGRTSCSQRFFSLTGFGWGVRVWTVAPAEADPPAAPSPRAPGRPRRA